MALGNTRLAPSMLANMANDVGEAMTANESMTGIEAAQRMLELAQELVDLNPDTKLADAIAVVVTQVGTAGWPAAGRGMAANHEWTEWQIDLLAAALYKAVGA